MDKTYLLPTIFILFSKNFYDIFVLSKIIHENKMNHNLIWC